MTWLEQNYYDLDGWKKRLSRLTSDAQVHRLANELMDQYRTLHAHLHHFEKYHAEDGDAFDGGEHYLGVDCAPSACEFSRAQVKAVKESRSYL